MFNTAVVFALLSLASAPAQAPPAAPSLDGPTRSLQGDSRAWTESPYLHQVWERLRVACTAGCAKADAGSFEREAIALMQEMAPTVGMTRQAMAQHVAAIPRQLLKIGAEDPSILTSYDKFIIALVGPA